MKLYHTDDGVWHGTQADAKRHARANDTDWEERNVPTDKPGLIEYLNDINLPPPVTATQLVPVYGEPVDELHLAEQRAIEQARGIVDQRPAQAVEKIQRDWDAGDIVDFILNRATVAQCENVFASLGTRFKEQVNEASNL